MKKSKEINENVSVWTTNFSKLLTLTKKEDSLTQMCLWHLNVHKNWNTVY